MEKIFLILMIVCMLILTGCSSVYKFIKNIDADNKVELLSRPVINELEDKILFDPEINDMARIVLYDVKSNTALCIKPPLSETGEFFNPILSFDYRKIYFIWLDGKNKKAEACSMNLDGGDFKQLTHSGLINTEIFYCPKKNLLGLIRTSNNIIGAHGDIILYDLEKNTEKLVYQNTNYLFIYNPTFSDNGESIYFSVEYIKENPITGVFISDDYNLIKMDVNTGITSDLIVGKRLLFASNIPEAEKILFYGSDLSYKVAEKRATDASIIENRGFYSYSVPDNKITLLTNIDMNYYYLSVTYSGRKALFINLHEFYEYDIAENTVTKLNIDKAEILRAVEEKGKKK